MVSRRSRHGLPPASRRSPPVDRTNSPCRPFSPVELLGQFPASRFRPGTPRGVRSAGMESLVQDLRQALRAVRANPLLSGVAMLSLALGIGPTTVLVSLIDGL